MRSLLKYLLAGSLLFGLTKATLAGNSTLADSANSYYSKAQYDKAIVAYQQLLSDNLQSASVYYNLGNCYYKQNKIGQAILYYKRALKIQPKDEDAQFNLKLALQKTEDKIDSAPQLFLSEWKTGLAGWLGESGWAWLSIVCLILALAGFALFRLGQRIFQKQLGFYSGIVFLLLFIGAFLLGRSAISINKDRSNAIILSPTVTALSAPSETATKLFVLHEGTEVKIRNTEANWTEIEIANGNSGWINTSALENI